ncbi:MAG: ABC transporter ATP-binding protein [Candidatus Ozemobacteraceae bacterium]
MNQPRMKPEKTLWKRMVSLFWNIPDDETANENQNAHSSPTPGNVRPAPKPPAATPDVRATASSRPALRTETSSTPFPFPQDSHSPHPPQAASSSPSSLSPSSSPSLSPDQSPSLSPSLSPALAADADADVAADVAADVNASANADSAAHIFSPDSTEASSQPSILKTRSEPIPFESRPAFFRPPVVTFKNVSKIFNPGTNQEYTAIHDINFEIEDLPDVGEFIALIGPSGCGKSTVLNLIQGFSEVWPPTTGEILCRNKPVTGPGRDRGMIFQKYSSFPHLTVLQNVMFGLRINQTDNRLTERQMTDLAHDIIRRVGLLGHEHKYPCQLSGGQQQRVAIARTLVLKPRIILMDEPFSALDEPTRIEMQQLITALWNEVEATVFIVTHSIAEAVFLGDRIFLFTPGPGTIAKTIPIHAADIGKEPGLSPLDVQEGPKFKAFLKDVTDSFLKIEQGA